MQLFLFRVVVDGQQVVEAADPMTEAGQIGNHVEGIVAPGQGDVELDAGHLDPTVAEAAQQVGQGLRRGRGGRFGCCCRHDSLQKKRPMPLGIGRLVDGTLGWPS